jgi:IPT/TIG domain
MAKAMFVGFLMLASIACGTSSTPSFTTPTSSALVVSTPTTPIAGGWNQNPTPTITSLSPTTAIAGSDDITITITGTNFVPYPRDRSPFDYVYWSIAVWVPAGGSLHTDSTLLETRFVSDTELAVIIPAKLLARPMSAQVSVFTINYLDWYDGDNSGPRSDPVTFTVVESH